MEYFGNLIFENGRLAKILFPGGYVSCSDNSPEHFTFHYYVQDHLGNNRAVVSEDGTIEQSTHYYPFGNSFADAGTSPSRQQYKYNGKELDRMHGLDWYDYGARNYDPVILIWDRMDQLCEDYYPISPYVYCMDNPVNATDPDGRSIDWYQDKDKTYQYSPNVHSQKDLSNGQHYIGKTFTRGNGRNLVQYRADGSILYNNETDAYKRMWSQADVHYRQMGERGGREVGGFILTSGKVLVLPDYKNDFNTSEISGYGYVISKNGTVTKGKEKFSALANIHTHQKGAGNPTPSFYGFSDATVSEQMGARPVFTMGHDGKVYGIISNQSQYAIFPLPYPYGKLDKLLNSQLNFSTYLKNSIWTLK